MTRNMLWLTFAFFFLTLLGGWGCQSADDDDASSDDDDAATDDDSAADDDAGDDDAADDDAVDDDTVNEDELLARFQPLLIQKLAPDYGAVNYPPESDLIGELSLHPGNTDFDYLVEVDTAAPVMYHFTAQAEIRGTVYQQLLYEFFYPERPLLYTLEQNAVWYLAHWFDAGAIDGKVVRVTLDIDNATPLFIEVMQSCGCGWKFYVNKLVDDAARAEFEAAGEPYPGLAKPAAPHDVPYVFVMAADVASAQSYPVVLDDYGWTDSAHNFMAAFTSLEQALAADLDVDPALLYVPSDLEVDTTQVGALEPRDFERLPYDPLYTMMPAGSEEEVGIFDEYGYIWNAYSPFWLAIRNGGTATEFPGTPRDPAAFEVVHETMDFWDRQTLFDTFIYLPESIFGPAR